MLRATRLAAALSAVLLAAPFAAPAAAEEVRYEIDPSHFSVVFSADHIGYGPTFGMFLRGGGSFMFDEDALTLSDVSVDIETASVFSNDDRRDGHLRNEDFLNSDVFPVANFVMTDYEKTSDTTGTITGNLTLIGETRPVTLDATLNKIGPYPFGDNYVVGVTLTTTIKRSEWGMNYAVDNGLVGDDVPMTIVLEAIRQPTET